MAAVATGGIGDTVTERIHRIGRKEAQEAQNLGMKDPVFELCDRVREASFNLHRHLRHGHVEKVYENGLANRLRKAGLVFRQQYPLQVFDEDGTALGEYFADLFVDQRVTVELKACKTLVDEHTAQVLGYLRASRVEHGMLINFGSPRLEVRKFALSDA